MADVPPDSTPVPLARVVVILIKPAHYDPDGFVYRFRRGVLPSNSLAAMHTLTAQALAGIVPAGVRTELYVLEDGVQRHARQLQRLARRFPEPGTRLIVGLVAVQTAQFPRACDLISQWQSRGAACVIGGFHVSGSIAALHDGIADSRRPGIPCPGTMPPEIQQLLDRGVVVFHGEAENLWPQVLRDLLHATPQPLYRGGQPPLHNAPLPDYPSGYFQGSFATAIQTFDTGRGCPFACSFCTIINVQGRQPRFRDPRAILQRVRRICEQTGQALFFLTDDNFARNPCWETILDGLIELRRQGYDIRFMVEADLACGNLKNFLPKLAAAGCSQIFMGVESLNPANLRGAGKHQNQVDRYARLFERCHEQGILVHAGYIIGLPHDTPESVRRDIKRLFELGVDQASFFMLTPLPGSEDHVRLHQAGAAIDADYNRYDSFQPAMDHPAMSRQQWTAAYRDAWRSFYSVGNMVTALRRCRHRARRWDLLCNYVWYRWSFATEATHPMIAGFYRYRPYGQRRRTAAPLSWPRYVGQELWRHARYLGRFLAEFYVFQFVVFETELVPALTEGQELLGGRLRGIGDWYRRTFGRVMSRKWLNGFWINYARNRWQLLNPLRVRWHLEMLPHAATEVIYTMRFAWLLWRRLKAEGL